MNELIKKITKHEGYRRYAYLCPTHRLTIGIGRNIDERGGFGITRTEAIYLLQNDLKRCRNTLNSHVWFRHMDEVRQGVLIELMFNVGPTGFYSFKKMIKALSMNDYKTAEEEMLDSKWRWQVGEERAADMAFRMRYGAYEGKRDF